MRHRLQWDQPEYAQGPFKFCVNIAFSEIPVPLTCFRASCPELTILYLYSLFNPSNEY